MKKDTKFIFTLATHGLPNFYYLNEKSKPDVNVLSKNLHSLKNRAEKRAALKLFQRIATNYGLDKRLNDELLDYYMDQSFRRALFWDIFTNTAETKQLKFLHKLSFEYLYIETAAFKFPLREIPSDEQDREINMEYILEMIHPECSITVQRLSSQKKEKINALVAVWHWVEKDLLEKKHHDDPEYFASLIFSYATIFGPAFYEAGLKAAPELEEHFKHLKTLPENLSFEKDDSTIPSYGTQEIIEEGKLSEDINLPNSIEECLEKIKQQSAQLSTFTLTIDKLENLSELVKQAQILVEKAASGEVFQNVRDSIFEFLFDLARHSGSEGMKDEDFSAIVARSWEKYLGDNESSIFGEWQIENLLKTVSSEIIDASKARKASQKNVTEIEAALQHLKDHKPSSYLETKKREDEIVEAELAATEAKKELRSANNKLDLAILPPGVDFGNLEDSAVTLERLPSLAPIVTERIDSLLLKLKLSDTEDISPSNATIVDDDIEFDRNEAEPELSLKAAAVKISETEIKEEEEPDTDQIKETMPEIDVTPEQDQEIAAETEIDKTEKPEEIEVAKDKVVLEPEIVSDVEYTAKSGLELTQDILAEFEQKGVLSSANLNGLSFYCLAEGYINIAHKVAVAGEMCENPEDLVSPQLLESAYLGMNVWSINSKAFENSQKLLNTIDLKSVDSWLEKKNVDKAVAPLLFCACFQVILWGGNSTYAPTILNHIKNYFPLQITSLLKDLIQAINRGMTLTLEQLCHSKGDRVYPDVKADLKLSNWQDKILQSARGWTPMRMALRDCLKKGVFTEVTRIIANNDRRSLNTVKDFIKDYGVLDNVMELMNKSIAVHSNQQIISNARDTFVRTTNELREIAILWVAELPTQMNPEEEVREFIRTLPARLLQTAETFGAMSDCPASRVAETCARNIIGAINGDPNIIWSDERVRLWFSFPKVLMDEPVDITDNIVRLHWILDQLENGFDLELMYQNAFDQKAYHIAQLLLTTLKESGKEVSSEIKEIESIVLSDLRKLNSLKEDISLAVDTANISGLLTDEQHTKFVLDIEVFEEQVENFSSFVDLNKLASPLKELKEKIDDLFEPHIRKHEEDYRELLKSALQTIGEDAVPHSWQDQMEEALKSNDIPVIEEMIEALSRAQQEGVRLREDAADGNAVFAGFIKVEKSLQDFLAETKDPSQIIAAAVEEGPFNLDFSSRPSTFKPAVRALNHFRGAKPPCSMGSNYFNYIVDILKAIGIATDSSFSVPFAKKNYRDAGGFGSLKLNVKPCNAGAPFSDFGRGQETSLKVLISHREWDISKLKALLEADGIGANSIVLISASPLTTVQRRDFADYCKQNQKTVFIIDLAMIIYLASLSKEASPVDNIRNFLKLSTPLTYYNTYVGVKASPPDPEMRYGREYEISQLLNMNQGAAIVFGGRQLGKSTILSEVKSRFQDEDANKYAFYYHGDSYGYFDGPIDPKEHDEYKKRIWRIMYTEFAKHKLLREKIKPSDEEMRSAIKEAFTRKANLRVIVIFDEIDPLLEIDHLKNFDIFRGIRELVTAPEVEGRFKFIIGGLNNVKRFEDTPNYPLNQLGSSMPISIMSVADATRLIKEPLYAYGLQFENPLVPRRILSITNRHPSLIQIFNKELVNHMAINFKGEIGSQIISGSDISNVFKKEEVRDHIRQRFDMTLNLDTRYGIIIYSLALEGRGTQPFSASQVRDAASGWLGELSKKTDMQIEAILNELVGLGVLRKTTGHGYALRNTNILNLLGTQDQIELKLLQVKEHEEKVDPLERHAFIEDTGIPSPLTYRDEKQILGKLDTQIIGSEKTGIKQSQKYTVNIISGSQALGLNQLETTLPYIDDFSLEWTDKKKSYAKKIFLDSGFEGLSDFNYKLRRQIDQSKTKAQIIIIQVTGEWSAEELYAAIDVAYQAKENVGKQFEACRVIFAVHPPSLWKWLTSNQNIPKQEQALPHISLDLWKRHGLQDFLGKIHLPNTDARAKRLDDYTLGWHTAITRLSALKKDNPNANSITALGIKKITEMTVKDSDHFLKSTGIMDLDWSAPLLRKLIVSELDNGFDEDTIKILIDDGDVQGLDETNSGAALEWMNRLCLIVRKETRSQKNQAPTYVIEDAVKSCLVRTHE